MITPSFYQQYFTIIDFRNVTDKFADKEFDGSPVKIKVTNQDEPISEEVIDNGEGEEQIDPVTGKPVEFLETIYPQIDDGFGTSPLG